MTPTSPSAFRVSALLLALLLAPAIPAPARTDAAPPPAAEAVQQGVVSTCFDGDTFRLADRRSVRLAGVDAPETGRNGRADQYYAREARDLLVKLAQGKRVRLKPVSRQEAANGFGKRLIADAILPDGASCSAELVREGASYVSWHADLDSDFFLRLKALQTEAIKERRGMWGRILDRPEARQPLVGNAQSRRFHLADSEHARKIRPRNRVFFGTLMDAFLAGYAPARASSDTADSQFRRADERIWPLAEKPGRARR